MMDSRKRDVAETPFARLRRAFRLIGRGEVADLDGSPEGDEAYKLVEASRAADDYYRRRAAAFRERPTLPLDDDSSDERLFP